jgi:hypothetical protein
MPANKGNLPDGQVEAVRSDKLDPRESPWVITNVGISFTPQISTIDWHSPVWFFVARREKTVSPVD